MERKQSHKYLLEHPEPMVKSAEEIKQTVLNYDIDNLTSEQKTKVIRQLQNCLIMDTEIIKERDDIITRERKSHAQTIMSYQKQLNKRTNLKRMEQLEYANERLTEELKFILSDLTDIIERIRHV